jgi:hypothetical protein
VYRSDATPEECRPRSRASAAARRTASRPRAPARTAVDLHEPGRDPEALREQRVAAERTHERAEVRGGRRHRAAHHPTVAAVADPQERLAVLGLERLHDELLLRTSLRPGGHLGDQPGPAGGDRHHGPRVARRLASAGPGRLGAPVACRRRAGLVGACRPAGAAIGRPGPGPGPAPRLATGCRPAPWARGPWRRAPARRAPGGWCGGASTGRLSPASRRRSGREWRCSCRPWPEARAEATNADGRGPR